MAKIIDAYDIAWGQCKLEYAQQDSLVDMGELYYWACKWHEKYHAQAEAMKVMREALQECDDAMGYMSEYDIPLCLPDRVKEALAAADKIMGGE